MSRHAFEPCIDDALDSPKRAPAKFHVEYQLPDGTDWKCLSLPRDCFVAIWDDEQFCGELREYFYATLPAVIDPDDLTFRFDNLYTEALRINREPNPAQSRLL